MSGKKLYRTKICVLHERGRCWRQSCSFAHGEAELRRFSTSFDDRQDSRFNDSTDRFERRRSTQRMYSPEATTETRVAVQGHSPLLSFRRRRKSKQADGQSNFSGVVSVPDGAEVQDKEGKLLPSNSRDVFRKQLKQVKFDIDFLVDQKSKLEAELEERAQEADSLFSRIQDLEAQLSEEKEHCMRITSKIKKFIRSQNNCMRLHQELKRSEVRLDKVVEELDLDVLQLQTNEDSSINILSDGETIANHMVNHDPGKRKDLASFANKKLHINIEAEEGSRSVSLAKRSQFAGDKSLSQKAVDNVLSSGRKESAVGNKRKDAERLQSNDGKPKRRRDGSKGLSSSDKVKVLENHQLVPPTSIAAHAMDEYEAEERTDVAETDYAAIGNEVASASTCLPFPLPPLPSFSQNNYSEYEGDDEDVNVHELEEDTVEVACLSPK